MAAVNDAPESYTYRNMIARCYNEKHPSYKDYGGRGIRVCDRWLQSYSNFINDIGARPSKKHQLDRMNNDGDYSPDNCKWSTSQKNNNNRRNTIYIEYKGETATIAEWCRRLSLDRNAIYQRYIHGDRGDKLFRPIKRKV